MFSPVQLWSSNNPSSLGFSPRLTRVDRLRWVKAHLPACASFSTMSARFKRAPANVVRATRAPPAKKERLSFAQSADRSRQSTMTEGPPKTQLSLDECIQKVKNLCHVSSRTAAEVSQVYLACVCLLCHLKEDQATLYRIRNERGENAECPPGEETPAFTAVIQDATLFGVLIRCLLTATGGSTDVAADAKTALGTSVHTPLQQAGRKRSLSMTRPPDSASAHPNKAMKLTHSPVPGAGSRHKLMQDLSRNSRRPAFNVPALAATILYAAMQPVDHWPVQLVQAYAEDSFGPRLWVDDEQCALLAQNLALVHTGASDSNGSDDEDDAQKLRDAASVAEAYRTFDASAVTTDFPESSSGTGTPGRRGSMDSHSSLDRSSGNSSRVRRQLSSGRSADSVDSRTKKNAKQGGDSDSGDEQMLVGTAASDLKRKHDDGDSSSGEEDEGSDGENMAKRGNGDGDSSSSGEEDEDVIMTNADSPTAQRAVQKAAKRALNFKDSNGSMSVDVAVQFYPVQQRRLNLTRVRRRYFGANLDSAKEAIASSLHSRLDLKTKQNSGLLQTLPSFTSVPGVRRLIAENLEKWLQSPALAGLARALFSKTVNDLENQDPPLNDDIKAINSILSMRLKANQLNAHIENVTAIARRIPVASVANHMYAILLGEVVKHSDSASLLDLDRIKMLVAVHREISSHVSYDAMAAALLTLLVSHQPNGNLSAALSRAERGSLVKKLRRIIRAVAFELGPSFDGCMLVEALLSLDVSTDSWSTRDEEDKARLMYQCVTVSVSPFLKDYAANKMSVSAKSSVRELLKKARKSLLAWCCTEYGPRFAARTNGKSSKPKLEELSEACATDFNSALGPSTAEEIPSWLETMRCVLFMEDPYSSRMKELLAPGEFAAAQDADWDEELTRISLCCEFGADLSDELLWVVLKSASLSHGGIDSQMAVQLLEHLFLCCGRTRSGTLEVSDPNLVWEFYNLVHFDPPKHFVDDDSLSDDSDNFPGEHLSNGSKMHDIPRLARPGMWWRVTMLALVMCGSSKESIGSTAWNEHPTLRALIKMITSTRYRFPTVDCDEQARAEMKKAEQNARDEESQIAELLFLPKRPEKKKEQKKAGARVSRRLQKKQQEKEAAKELAETNRRKKLLRVAQKSIMLWDPDGPARKPPKESVDLLLSIEERFDLSNIFQRSTTPDFLLMTIGQTTRGAIERAYDWLIPIISALPDAIARLPSSASCFLLLKAYGTDGEERKQLKQLSAPLLSHVKESLNGDYGEQDSIKAFDLLMSDVASHKPALRRCARKVLQDALLRPEGKTSWMLSILLLDHAKSLVNHAVKHMATAATFERGRVLRSLLMALEQHIQFAEKHDVKVEWRFPELLINLMSRRPNVCAEAMDAFSDLLSMAVRVLHSEFLRYAQGPGGEIARNGEPVVVMKTYGTTSDEATTVTLPLSLLQSVSVVLSTWKEQESGLDQQATSSVDYLANVLLCSIDCSVANNELGLASAKIQDGEGVAASVEFWIMLAKARSDSMARRAALSAPANVLPRLLLSSGLPRASLLTMIDRLGRLGDSVEDKDEAFLALLVPSASSDWDIGRVGSRHEISRKLLGRISAYMRLNNVTFGEKDSEVSATFLAWLSRECRAHKDRKPKKTKQKKPGASVADSLSSLAAASSVLSTLEQDAVSPVSDFTMGRWGGSMDELKRYEESSRITPADDMGSDSAKAFITSCLSDNQFVALDEWLGSFFANHGIDVSKSESAKDHDFVDLSAELLRGYKSLEHPLDGTTRIIFKWVPRISQCKGNPDLWQIMFCRSLEKAQSSFSCQLLTKCLASWTEQHVNSCRDWILGMADNNEDDYDCDLFATFIVSTSRQLSSQVDRFSETSPLSIESDWANSRPFVISCTKIAMRCLKQCPADSKETVSRRNGLPPGLTLILLVARRGKKQLQCVTEGILQELSASEGEDEDIHKIFGGIFLRLYLSFPQWMDLGSPVVRTALMQASEAFSSHWTDWRSDFDDKLDDMFDAVISGELRLTKPLTEMARKHPLLLLRKLQAWSRSLESDATCNGRESNGVISGQHLSGPRTAKLCGKIVRVTIRHWGYSFTEPVWIALLDIISAIPREVLFTCGPKLGLLDFLAVYLQLMSVQIQLLSANEAARLKDKLAEFFGAFQEHSPKGWKSWLGSKIGETEVRHMLMVCDYITPQQAIESLKDA